MSTLRLIRGLLLASIGVASLTCGPAFAQDPSISPPPVNQSVDGRGVDVIAGTFRHSVEAVSIGQPGSGGINYVRTYSGTGWRDNMTGTIFQSGTQVIVSVGGASVEFVASGSTYTPVEDTGATLDTYMNFGTLIYRYQTADGTIYLFHAGFNQPSGQPEAIARLVNKILPNGHAYYYGYQQLDVRIQPTEPETITFWRLAHVQSSTGWGIHLNFEIEEPVYQAELGDAFRVTKATAFNGAVDVCLDYQRVCTFSRTWPSATFTATTMTDQASRVTTYTFGSNGITSITLPGSSVQDVAVSYSGGRVSGVTDATGSWNYAYSDSGTTRTTTVTGPLSQQQTYVSNTGTQRVTSVTTATGSSTSSQVSYQYDGQGRLTRVTMPEGNYTSYTYGSRGNVTEVRQVAKPSSGLADITVTASYPSTCSDRLTCNKPTWTRDELNRQTDYTYDNSHGGVLTVTSPSPDGTSNRPQTRFSYDGLYAWVKDYTGSLVAVGPISMLVGTSQCTSGSSCAGAASEVKTSIGYGSSGVANNLLPTSATTASGNNSLSATTSQTYDPNGDLVTYDGPLSGSDDTTYVIYDVARRVTGVVGPDPDGGGALLRRAQRYTYNGRSLVTLTEKGTANTNLSSFVTLQQSAATYDSYGRLSTTAQQAANGTTYSLSQTTYDSAGRPNCTAVRMDPAAFGSLPTSACTLPTPYGPFGPDRIVQTTYDYAGRPTNVAASAGTSAALSGQTSYTANGRIATITDGQGNMSTYVYDGFDRVSRLRYPLGSGGGSSTTDYDEYTYDAASNVTQRRSRAGQTFSHTYDNLDRITIIDAPSGTPDTYYSYDFLNRQTRASDAASGGTEILMTWDALGRMITQGGVLGTMTMGYDLAGRRTSLTWPDSFNVTYEYNLTHEMTAIKLSGSTQIMGYSYDNLGRRIGVTRGNGITTAYAYDAVSRLTSLAHDFPGGTTNDQSWTYGYNPAGQVFTQTQSNDLYAFGGRTAATDTYTNNGLNQVTAVNAAGVTYNTNGDLTSDGTRTYVYDAVDRPISTNGGASTLSYDPLGRLRSMVGTAGAQYLYEGVALAGASVNGSVVSNRIIQGPWADEMAVAYQGSGSTDPRWSLQDRLGSVVAITDSSAAVNAFNSYDEYGRPASGNGGRMMYTGQMWLPDFGVYHYKTRQYHPALGRFLQPDLMGYEAGSNVYAYVSGDPINLTDQMGLQACWTDENGQIICPPVVNVYPRPFEPRTSFDCQTPVCLILMDRRQSFLDRRLEPDFVRPGVFDGEFIEAQARPLPPSSSLFARPPLVRPPLGQFVNRLMPGLSRGLPPRGMVPPRPGPWRVGPASRSAERAQGGRSLWSPRGEEIRWYPGDARHNPHWDYNPHNVPNARWQNIPHGGFPTTIPTGPVVIMNL